jgi:hypothetical protein
MPKPNVGQITCPSCDFPDAHVRETIKGKVYIVCDECGFQAFTRGEISNAKIRAKMRAAPPVELPPEIPVPPKKVPRKTAKPAAAAPAAPTKTEGEFGTWLGL